MKAYPFRGVKRKGRFRYDELTPKFFRMEFPCLVGHRSIRNGKIRIRWISFGWDIGITRKIEEAAIVKDWKQLDALLAYVATFKGTQGIFVQPQSEIERKK